MHHFIFAIAIILSSLLLFYYTYCAHSLWLRSNSIPTFYARVYIIIYIYIYVCVWHKIFVLLLFHSSFTKDANSICVENAMWHLLVCHCTESWLWISQNANITKFGVRFAIQQNYEILMWKLLVLRAAVFDSIFAIYKWK